MVRLGKSNPPTIYTWRQPPGRLLALFLSWDVTLVRLDLFTLNHQYFPHHYFIFPPVLQIQCSSCCGVALVITIIHHRSCVIDHTSETIGNRSEMILPSVSQSERLKHLDHLLHQLWSKVESSAQEEGKVMVACREYETFVRSQGGCRWSIGGADIAWRMQIGTMGGCRC